MAAITSRVIIRSKDVRIQSTMMITPLEGPHLINPLTIVNMLEKKMRIVIIVIQLPTISEIVLIRDESITQDRWVTVI